jgi:hypothetical protein
MTISDVISDATHAVRGYIEDPEWAEEYSDPEMREELQALCTIMQRTSERVD